MKSFWADLHIHVGINERGQWVKIPTSRQLTIKNILNEATNRKGMNIIGIVDAMSPLVMEDLEELVTQGVLLPQQGGGYSYCHQVALVVGAEIETVEENGRRAHTLVFLPTLKEMKRFSLHMSNYIRNINLSSQNAHISLGRLINICLDFDAIIIPAHVFTPYKSIYGNCCKRLADILSESQLARIDGIELGLSADSLLADRIAELSQYNFITNSDAHSLDKIAREYTIFELNEPSFAEIRNALHLKNGCRIKANYGLDPRLGKYHKTVCRECGLLIDEETDKQFFACPLCGCTKYVNGVFNRIDEIADFLVPQHPVHRPPYYYQIPLEFIPGIGKKTMKKLLDSFKTEMNIIHNASYEELAITVGENVATSIMNARTGTSTIIHGGGGTYGRIK